MKKASRYWIPLTSTFVLLAACGGEPEEAENFECRLTGECEVAPPLDRTVATTLWESAAYLLEGKDPLQKDVAKGALEPGRLALVHGKVVDAEGAPLLGVRLSVLHHPEYGWTFSRADGTFDLAVNGGEPLTIEYRRRGFLRAQRTAQPAWQRHAQLPVVGLVPKTKEGKQVSAGSDSKQVVEAPETTDAFGSRRPLVLFAPGTQATARLSDGSRKELELLTVQVTEYPIVTEPLEMQRFAPGSSADTSGSYALDFSVEEAEGAEGVEFDRPVTLLVENFLELKVGEELPMGYYNLEDGAWEEEEPARALAILSEKDGRARIDVDGDGEAESEPKLEEWGITEDELRVLADKYEPGDSVVRARLEHFSAHRMEIPTNAPSYAVPPTISTPRLRPLEKPSKRKNTRVETQTVAQPLELIGTPFSLLYQSDRSLGFKPGFQIELPLLDASVPRGLVRVHTRVTIAGRQFEKSFAPKAKLKYSFEWDGKDNLGRLLQGQQTATVEVGFEYPGQSPAKTKVANVTWWRSAELPLGVWDATGYELGGTSLDALHAYDPAHHTLYFGDGTEKRAENIALVVRRLTQSDDIGDPDSVAITPDGSILLSDDAQGRLLRIDRDGKVTPLAGSGAKGKAGELSLASPQGVARAKDGSIWMVDYINRSIFRIRPNGAVETVVGPEGSGARVVRSFDDLESIAWGPHGELYLTNGSELYKLKGKKLTRFAGGGELSDDGVPARQKKLERLSGVAVGPDGTVYLSEWYGHRVHQVTPDGTIHVVAGTGNPGFGGDGGLGPLAALDEPRGLAVGSDGTLYIADQSNGRIRMLSPDGVIQTLAGGGEKKLDEGHVATSVALVKPDGLAVGQDGSLVITSENAIYRVTPGTPELGTSNHLIPSRDGRTFYKFDARGKHRETLDAVSGVTLFSFSYDERGLLTEAKDRNGLPTRFERDAAGALAKVVGPYGHTTRFSVNEVGLLERVVDPIERETTFTYDEEKMLLTSTRDPEGGERHFEYDVNHRLVSVTDPTGYKETFARKDIAGGYAVSVTTPGGSLREYSVTTAPGGILEWALSVSGERTLRLRDNIASRTLFPGDGSKIFVASVADDYFGPQVMRPSIIEWSTSAGRTMSVHNMFSRTLSNPDSALSLEDWTELVDINGRFYESKYDRKSRTLTSTSPEGRSSTTVFDERGRPISHSAGDRATRAWSYDELGRVTRMTSAADGKERAVSFGYDGGAWVTSIDDPLKRRVELVRDGAGRLVQLDRPDGDAVRWELDATDNVVALQPAGRGRHEFGYTGHNLLERYLPPAIPKQPEGTGSIVFSYGKDSELKSIDLSGGRSLGFKYDGAQRLKELKVRGATLSYGSSPTNRVTLASRSDGARVDVSYDGPLWSGASWKNAITGTVRATYDDDFWLTSLGVNGSSSVSFTYDADGLLLSAGTSANRMTLTRSAASGQIEGTRLGVVSTTEERSGFGELSRLSAAESGGSLFSQSLTRDALGRVTRVVEDVLGVERTTDYQYDALGQLERVVRDGITTVYTYDVNGNRTSVQVGGSPAVKAKYDAQDRIVSYGAQSYEHSPHGEMIERTDGTLSLGLIYDELGNLKSAQLESPEETAKIDYIMDGLGRRVARRIDGSFDRAWLYQDSLRPISEVTSAGVFSHFVYASDAPAGAPDFMLRGGVPYRFVKDHLGSVRLVVNATTGEAAQELDYDEFGRVQKDTNPGFQPFGFAGGLYDWDTKLVRFGARDYDPGMGRWTLKDPIGFAGRQGNVYVYVGNDPVNWVDPSGLLTIGVGVQFSGCVFSLCGGVSLGMVGDDVGIFGNVDLNIAGSIGWATQVLGGSAGIYGEYTSAGNIADLEGWSRYGGMSAGELMVVGVRAVHQGLEGAGGYYGTQAHAGVGAGLPLELETGASYSYNLFAEIKRKISGFFGE